MADGKHIEVAKAYVTIVPSMEGSQKTIATEMGAVVEPAAKETGEKSGKHLGERLAKGLKATAAVIGAAMTAATAGAIATGKAFINAANSTAQYGDNIDKMSQKLGLSTTAFQQWDYVLSQSGADINSMGTGLKTLTNKIDDAKNGSESAQAMFAQLGLSMEDLNSMSREDVFGAVITGFQGMADSTERAALANDLFGRSGQELTPLFNTSVEETQAMMAATEELGMVMSAEAVKAAADYKDSMDTLQRTFGGLKNSLMGEFLPSITSVTDGLAKLMSGDSSGLGQIKVGISAFIKHISDAVPEIFNTGAEIILALAESVTQNLPELLSAAADMIMTIGMGLVEQLPLIIETGMDIIMALADGIIQNLPDIIPAVVDVVIQIVDSLVDNVDMLVDASIEIIMALANGLIKALPRLIEKAPEIVGKLVDAIVRNAPKLLSSAWELIKTLAQGIVDNLPQIFNKGVEIVNKVLSGIKQTISGLWSAGMDIVRGIWQGISDGFGWIKTKISGWVGNVMDFIKGLFGIHSPSTWARDVIGENLAKGIGVGFEDGMSDVEKMMRRSIPTVGSLMGNMNFSGAAASGNLAPAYNYGGVTIQIMGREKDAEQLAVELQAALVRRAAVWA